jgi:hypothetical protein
VVERLGAVQPLFEANADDVSKNSAEPGITTVGPAPSFGLPLRLDRRRAADSSIALKTGPRVGGDG